MSTNREIPKEFENIFNNWDEYKEYCIQKSIKELLKAFPNEDTEIKKEKL
tara:strand:+ start:523 stop:672 length:150 start_codon:yes stop_codon:yes gene_type:complete